MPEADARREGPRPSHEGAFEECERTLRQLQRRVHAGVWRYCVRENRLWWSEELYRIFGFDPTAGVPTTEAVLERIHPDDREAFRREVASGQSDRSDYRIVLPDGSLRHIHEEVDVERGEDGAVVKISGTAQDATERRNAEHELWVRSWALDSALSGIAIAGLDGNLTYVNASLVAMWGYREAGELLGRPAVAFWWQSEQAEQVIAALRAVGQWEGDLEAVRVDGTIFPVHLSATLVRGREGAPVGMMGSFVDTTERTIAERRRLELERRLLHAQKLESLGVLAGGIAHDFNNLLMAVLGNLDLALLTLPPRSAERSYIEQSVQAVYRAANLTQQMLAYSGRSSFAVERIDLASLVRESVELFRASIARTAAFDCRLPEGLPAIVADLSQVQQVVMNLITNASESIGEAPGTITLTVGARDFDARELAGSRVEAIPDPGRFVYLEVADSGCGMDRQTLERLFEPFFTTKFTGRGLGMSSVLGIVRGHGGAIFVDSAVGRGTTVRVLFPAAGAPGRETASVSTGRAPLAPASPGPRWILVVDDEASVLEVCRNMLATLGWQVLAAGDGLHAVEAFRNHAPKIACVVLDLSMPGMDGIATLAELRRVRPEVRVILTSGYAEQDATARFTHGGLAGFIQKPYTIEKLRAAIGSIMREEQGAGG